MCDDLRAALRDAFRRQQQFADGYSPLYDYLFGLVAGWLADGGHDPIADWLVELAAARRPFDVTLLLPAALHRDVLAGVAAAAPLASFYPTVGGIVPDDPVGLAAALRDVIAARREALTAFIGRANVQTNETGRGLAWLLPVAALGWPAVHLVELGASAGLNLAAERRHYRLVDAGDGRALMELGMGEGPQFTMVIHGPAQLGVDNRPAAPLLVSRTGGDVYPFHLRTAEDEVTLAAFIWADQPQRLARLREGIAALHAVEQSDKPARLTVLDLPDGLPAFLASEVPAAPDAPVVLFNTTVTMYLRDGEAGLRRQVTAWAAKQARPVLWLQWEPATDRHPPERDWLAWTADLWQSGSHHQLQLGWVHPHGTAAHNLNLSELVKFA